MILQSALKGWFGKGRGRSREALELIRMSREETEQRLQEIISRLDGEDQWFMENHQSKELRCACAPRPDARNEDA